MEEKKVEFRWRPFGGELMTWCETLTAMAESYGTYNGMWHVNEFWQEVYLLVPTLTEDEAEQHVVAIHTEAERLSAEWHYANIHTHSQAPVVYTESLPSWQVLVVTRDEHTPNVEGLFIGSLEQATEYANELRAGMDADDVTLFPMDGAVSATYKSRLSALKDTLKGFFGDGDNEAI